MEDRNSPEAMAARASQPDPIVMYLVVRESLGMGVGKTAAQCAHASQMLQIQFEELKSKDLCGWCEGTDKYNIELFNKWLDTSYRKVVLKASEKEWGKLKELMTDTDVLVIDLSLIHI